MKKKKILVYALSALIPVTIFLIATIINGYLPFGKEMLNAYDSFTQYSGMLLEYKNLLRTGNIFYSWNAGLGFNFFGTLTYYGASPLNLLCVFATPKNYPFFITFMTFLRFALLGITMCFYLEKKGTKPFYIVLFSTIFALMGYTSTYYYNYIWIDSIIMLPLVIHGLEKLINENKPKFYIISLGFTILINYYIGYMICIFVFVYFLYKLINKQDKKKVIKTFVISSLLAGLIGAIAIIPSYFALQTGKSILFETTEYGGINRNALTFFYTLMTGAYQTTDQTYGPAQIYSTIMVLVLTIFYFFNTKFTLKEKLATLAVIVFFYLSFSVNVINLAWHFFQKPIWWQSRFSFVFSFFLINIALETLNNIDKVEFKPKFRILAILFMIGAVAIGAYFKWQVIEKVEMYTYIYLLLNLVLFVEMIFLLDKKHFWTLLICFTALDLFVNTYNSLKNNYMYNKYTESTQLVEDVITAKEYADKNNEYFYRMELADDYTSNDGLYFGFKGLRYFNSVRNVSPLFMMEDLQVNVSFYCHVMFDSLDPLIMSLFNIKYIYGEMDYFKQVDKNLYENPYPLAVGFTTNNEIKDLKLNKDFPEYNISTVINTLTGQNFSLHDFISYDKFTLNNLEYSAPINTLSLIDASTPGYATVSFISDKDYLFVTHKFETTIKRNGEIIESPIYYVQFNKGDKIEITYTIEETEPYIPLEVKLLNIHEYEEAMKILSTNLLKAKTYVNGHILEGEIDITTDKDYLFTSIEYEKGMKIYVDGKKVEPDILLNSLIGLQLSKGHHTIAIDYVPNGFVPGMIISATAIIGTFIYLQKKKKSL